MAGMTSAGFETKRLTDIIEEQNTNATTIFQDLVPEGDVVDTSPSSTIGRIIGLSSAQFADLWEALQEVYAAFDPNSATGVALDNLVALNGTVRQGASATTVYVAVWATDGTIIYADAQLSATTGDIYLVLDDYTVSATDCIGAELTVATATSGTEYSVTVTTGNTTVVASVTATSSSTTTTIAADLKTQLAALPYFVGTSSQNVITFESSDVTEKYSITTSNVDITSVKGYLQAENSVTGSLSLAAGAITSFITPISGISSVTNPAAGETGEEEETDDELRERFSLNKYRQATNINESLYAALIDVEGVSAVRIYENITSTTNTDYDLPGHSFKPVISGGTAEDIATAIWANQPLGISSEGNTSYTITDSQGFTHEIKFERPVSVPVYLDIEIASSEGQTINTATATAIKTSILAYFATLSFGEDVVRTRLYTPINESTGFQVNHVYVGTSASPTSENNVVIAYNELATISSENITVTIVE